eukprot:4088824-Pyramimonas_sp.AAC.1
MPFPDVQCSCSKIVRCVGPGAGRFLTAPRPGEGPWEAESNPKPPAPIPWPLWLKVNASRWIVATEHSLLHFLAFVITNMVHRLIFPAAFALAYIVGADMQLMQMS